MKNKILLDAVNQLDKENSKAKTERHTGNHLLNKNVPQLQTAKTGTFHSFATTKNNRVLPSTCKKKYLNPWSGITGIGLLKPSMSRNAMKRIIESGRAPTDEATLQKFKDDVDLANAVNELQETIDKDQPESNFCFPDTEFDFDLADAVRTSIINYKKAKSKFGMMEGEGDRHSSLLKA